MGALSLLFVLWFSVLFPKMLTIVWSPYNVKDGGWWHGQVDM
jgi:hypothetical protein